MSIPCTRDQWDYVGSLAEERQWGPTLGLVAGIPVIATGKNYGDGTIEQLEPSGVFTLKSETNHRYSDTSAYEVNGWSLLYDNAISGSPMLFQGHWRPAIGTVIRSKWASSSFYVATYFRSLETRHKYSDIFPFKVCSENTDWRDVSLYSWPPVGILFGITCFASGEWTTWNNNFTSFVKSKPVKQEVSCTYSGTSPSVSVLWSALRNCNLFQVTGDDFEKARKAFATSASSARASLYHTTGFQTADSRQWPIGKTFLYLWALHWSNLPTNPLQLYFSALQSYSRQISNYNSAYNRTLR